MHRTCRELSLTSFVWNARKPHEATGHITSHDYDTSISKTKNALTLDALLSSLCVQEDPHTEHPFHGLINAVKVSPGLHNGLIYVSIRSFAQDSREQLSEKKAMENTTGVKHFAVVVDPSDLENSVALVELDRAAEALGCWLKGCSVDTWESRDNFI
jgi:hypothetical protein